MLWGKKKKNSLVCSYGKANTSNPSNKNDFNGQPACLPCVPALCLCSHCTWLESYETTSGGQSTLLHCLSKNINTSGQILLQYKFQGTNVYNFHALKQSPESRGRQFVFGIIRQKFHNNLSAYCNLGSLKEHYTYTPLLGSVYRLDSVFKLCMTEYFQPVTVLGCITLLFLATGDAVTSWLAGRRSYAHITEVHGRQVILQKRKKVACALNSNPQKSYLLDNVSITDLYQVKQADWLKQVTFLTLWSWPLPTIVFAGDTVSWLYSSWIILWISDVNWT